MYLVNRYLILNIFNNLDSVYLLDYLSFSSNLNIDSICFRYSNSSDYFTTNISRDYDCLLLENNFNTDYSWNTYSNKIQLYAYYKNVASNPYYIDYKLNYLSPLDLGVSFNFIQVPYSKENDQTFTHVYVSPFTKTYFQNNFSLTIHYGGINLKSNKETMINSYSYSNLNLNNSISQYSLVPIIYISLSKDKNYFNRYQFKSPFSYSFDFNSYIESQNTRDEYTVYQSNDYFRMLFGPSISLNIPFLNGKIYSKRTLSIKVGLFFNPYYIRFSQYFSLSFSSGIIDRNR